MFIFSLVIPNIFFKSPIKKRRKISLKNTENCTTQKTDKTDNKKEVEKYSNNPHKDNKIEDSLLCYVEIKVGFYIVKE